MGAHYRVWIDPIIAEAAADAPPEHIMLELVSKTDL